MHGIYKIFIVEFKVTGMFAN